ncbi:putative transcriptional regulator [Haemophilus parahaemolyticus]|uniref:Putative transcriptional regulator n=1 Tax=Haemophilus parahaemolyticus TaxID=735 RepID=A0A377HZ83_HAEPH|nr:helix-turn-helix transcriptional regulator [Haemophilus parahaemolyticus]STO63474.1 putative transcriptional regulator [Haemophilus parahaemolyticus]
MEIYDKVRIMREVNQWSQEDMAEKMGMSVTGYAKIERGQSNIHYDKLVQLAKIFNISLSDLISVDEKKPTWYFRENNTQNIQANYYATDEAILLELEKTKLVLDNAQDLIKIKDELISQKENEIKALKEIINLLKEKNI